MDSKTSEIKSRISVKWIKAESGNTYLCPANVMEKLDNPTEEDLMRYCVNESENPQND